MVHGIAARPGTKVKGERKRERVGEGGGRGGGGVRGREWGEGGYREPVLKEDIVFTRLWCKTYAGWLHNSLKNNQFDGVHGRSPLLPQLTEVPLLL